MKCTFFGHRTLGSDIGADLRALLVRLIEERGATEFLVGDHGQFDEAVLKTLRQLKKDYPFLSITVVLSYLPTERSPGFFHPDETVYPEGLEKVPRRFAIDRRNKMMADAADYVVTYVRRGYGGAAKFREYARRQGKEIFDL